MEEYKEGSLTEFWIKQGVRPIPQRPLKEGEEGFSWSEFINGLGRQPHKDLRKAASDGAQLHSN
jgi:hypothetical protein